ncbi:flagellar motor switch protein FliM [Georgenia satyanarayanai]|uniref:flagellar motor switch protein FliM n=1 Tax=Georgenia satyanarayanai TaxID=860221 RepID=UPI001263FCA9|nr:flagellar motor switch protein FliM [Georgenia satyanarayanai]
MGTHVTVPPSPGADGTVVYDFRRPMTLAREHARTLEVALGTFARQWSNQLMARLRVPTQVSLETVNLGTYDDYISGLPSPTTLVVCAVGPNRRPAIMQFPLESALTWVDQMLGGPGKPGAVPDRELTEIEQALLGELMTRVLGDLNYAFAGILAVDVELRRFQHSPQVLQLMTATTAVISATFSIAAGEHRATASLMCPAEGLIAVLRENGAPDQRSASQEAAEKEQRELLDRAVQNAPVEVAVRLAPVPVHPREVVSLAVGDLLPLHHPRSQPMDVVVGDRVLAQAVAGTNGSRLAGLVVNVKENS